MTDAGDLKAPPPDAPSNDRGIAPMDEQLRPASRGAKSRLDDPPTDRKTKPSARPACRAKTCCAGSTSAISKTTCAASLQWTTTSAACCATSTSPAWPPTPSSSTTPTRASIWASTAGSTSAGCTRNRCGRSAAGALARRHRARLDNRDLVSNLDLAETFLEIAASQSRPTCRARSLVPVMKARRPETGARRFTTTITKA